MKKPNPLLYKTGWSSPIASSIKGKEPWYKRLINYWRQHDAAKDRT